MGTFAEAAKRPITVFQNQKMLKIFSVFTVYNTKQGVFVIFGNKRLKYLTKSNTNTEIALHSPKMYQRLWYIADNAMSH
jgi:hypothetical protein